MNRLRKATVSREQTIKIRERADAEDAKGRYSLSARFHEQADAGEKDELGALRDFATLDVPVVVTHARELADFLEEVHRENMTGELPKADDPMKKHQTEEPGCSYCRAIREARETIKRLIG
jgi:hypothetical protein